MLKWYTLVVGMVMCALGVADARADIASTSYAEHIANKLKSTETIDPTSDDKYPSVKTMVNYVTSRGYLTTALMDVANATNGTTTASRFVTSIGKDGNNITVNTAPIPTTYNTTVTVAPYKADSTTQLSGVTYGTFTLNNANAQTIKIPMAGGNGGAIPGTVAITPIATTGESADFNVLRVDDMGRVGLLTKNDATSTQSGVVLTGAPNEANRTVNVVHGQITMYGNNALLDAGNGGTIEIASQGNLVVNGMDGENKATVTIGPYANVNFDTANADKILTTSANNNGTVSLQYSNAVKANSVCVGSTCTGTAQMYIE